MDVYGTVVVIGAKPDGCNRVENSNEPNAYIAPCGEGGAIMIDMNATQQRIVQRVIFDETLTKAIDEVARCRCASTKAKHVQHDLGRLHTGA